MQERLELSAEADSAIRPAFDDVRQKVVARAENGVVTAPGLIKIADLAPVREAIQEAWHDAVVMGVELAADQIGIEIPSGLGMAWWHVMEQAEDKRIMGIEAETMARVKSYVEQGLQEGWSPGKLARHIAADESHAFDRTRSLVIARTETGNAYNLGSLTGYRQSGRVDMVEVMDGDECTWPEGHGDEPFADGMIVTLAEAEDAPLAHPNCVRAFSPVVGDEVP